ncbi:MAG: CHAD domain-containing protein [Verrucomicrobiales bacterium]|nr:CHAD domain-containing protein [Verrucomicrobiales bacterium]
MNPPHPIPFELRSRETLKAGIRRLGDALAQQVQASIASGPENQESAVHEARLAIKRLRAAVRLLTGTLGEKAARRHQARLRNAARRLASARDVAVGVVTMDGLAKELPDALRSPFQAWRQRLAGPGHVPRESPARIAAHLKAAAGAIRTVSVAIDRTTWRRHGWETLEDGLMDTYRRARRRFRAAHTTDDEESFHRWRTAVKAFMYQLCLVRPIAPKRLGGCIKDLNRLQKSLGDEHDLAVLSERLANTKEAGKGVPKLDSKPIRRLIASRQQRWRKKALKEGRRLFADRPKQFIRRIHKEWKAWHRPTKSTPP